MKRIVLIVLLSFFSLSAGLLKAQEMKCEVQVNANKIEGSDKSIFQGLQSALYEFLNNTKFTEIDFKQHEKIECSFLIDIKSKDNEYFSAEINMALRRPVYKSSYNSPLFNTVDRKFFFEYMDGQTIDLNPSTYISDLASTMGFYIYVFLGLDFDSFSRNGGEPFFKVADQIAQSAPQNDKQPGWSSTGRQNRYALISEITNGSYSKLHDFLYEYHRMGLDLMSEKPNEGRAAILNALTHLQSVYERNSMSYFLQLIIETKRDEIIQIFSEGPQKEKTEASNIMKAIDPSQSSRYDAILQNSSRKL